MNKYLQYHLKWVNEEYSFSDIPLSQSITNDHRSQFLKYLSKKHEDWQVNQVDHALKTLDFTSIFSHRSYEASGISEELVNNWKAV